MRHLSRRLATVVLASAVLAGCGSDDGARPAAGASSFATRTIEAGDVTVEITPWRIDGGGASFEVVFDTHSVELDTDVAETSRLVVDGERWPTGAWDGAGPGGHHREGRLRFEPAGDAAGSAVLTIDGLPEPVRATWELEAS